MIKLDVKFKNWDKVLNRISKNIPTNTERAMLHILSLIKGKAQSSYLRGPSPQYLQISGGNLLKNIFADVEVKGNQVFGKLTVGQIAWYGAMWENRPQGMFKNMTPKQRPFVKPAYQDLERKLLDHLASELTKS
jgi:hypothetical protein